MNGKHRRTDPIWMHDMGSSLLSAPPIRAGISILVRSYSHQPPFWLSLARPYSILASAVIHSFPACHTRRKIPAMSSTLVPLWASRWDSGSKYDWSEQPGRKQARYRRWDPFWQHKIAGLLGQRLLIAQTPTAQDQGNLPPTVFFASQHKARVLKTVSLYARQRHQALHMAAAMPTDDETPQPRLDIDFISQTMVFIPSERCTISCGTVCVDPPASKVLLIFNKRLGIWQLPKGRKNIDEGLQSAALRETYEETGVHVTLLPLKIRTRSTQPPVATITVADTANGAAIQAPTTVSAAPIVPVSNPCGTADLDAHAYGLHPTVESPNTTGGNGQCRPNHDAFPSGRTGNCSSGARMALSAHTMADPKVTNDLFNTEFVGIVRYSDLQATTPGTIKTVFFYAATADSTAPLGPGALEDHEDLRAEWVGFQEASKRLRFGPEKEVICKVEDDMKRSGICVKRQSE